MNDRALMLARLRFLEQSHQRLQEMKTVAEQRYRLEIDRLLCGLRTASTLRGEEITADEDGRLPDEISFRLEQMVGHPEKGLKAREYRDEMTNLQTRLAVVIQEIEQILKFLQV